MPPIGKNADCFFAFHRAEGPYQASRQGRAASSNMELFKGVWGQCHQQANADVLIHLPCLLQFVGNFLQKRLSEKFLSEKALKTPEATRSR